MDSHEYNKIKLHRMVFFTDAVLAIILTLLVLELHLPQLADANSPHEMLEKLMQMRHHFYAFGLCFLAIAQCWLAFNFFFSLGVRYNETIGVLNCLLMLPMCLIPFSCSVIGDYPGNPMSYVIFGGLYLFLTGVMSFIGRYAFKKGLLTEHLDREAYEVSLKSQWLSPIIILLILLPHSGIPVCH